MKKKSIALLVVFVFCFVMSLPAFASSRSLVVDDAGLLTSSEKSELNTKLERISSEQSFDVAVVTVQSTGDKTAQAYADDYFINNGYGCGNSRDGVLFLLSISDRKWHISTHGYGITAITDAGLAYIFNQISGDLKSGNYYKAFDSYADLCEQFVKQAKTGKPYDTSNLPKAPFNVGKNILIALGVGLAAALVVTLIMKGKLKSVRFSPAANSYVKNGSMNVTHSHDQFLYSHVDRRAKPKDNDKGSSTHTSSSGDTFGGGGGSF